MKTKIIEFIGMNKEFISLFNNTLLSIVVIFTSIKSCQMYERQALAAEENFKPFIFLEKEIGYFKNKEDLNTQSLVAYNNRGIIKNLKYKIKSFIVYQQSNKNITDYYVIPVNFYNITYATHHSSGKLFSAFNINNYASYDKLVFEEQMNYNRNYFTKLDLITFINLKYEDYMNVSKTENYIAKNTEIIQAQDLEFEQCENELSTQSTPIDISNISFTYLQQKIQKHEIKNSSINSCKTINIL
ncbi:hypothetical protein [Leptospira bandrabouensis]|uniref:hypothetical protein n=1 Tax=Leptospira bandrabouensis TaxID=2484903 RepID=UPI001EE8837F|nr:hypothetical protein [Leptospira bandrabouensis]MCG6146638.1 hypothetical protein [Leptospira bandrabouensis]MCG6154144.1 hypothetical protein [Leptospira bandrabouensis]MCG6162087.1 hypothetical protein [Leptospira bandrabouensis]